ncbi:ABC transporter substrate-binding protein [Falsirhodobacter halotolerans]|uniref:ABC transporter substrate-binding protein n=1 Tax=Falsirhodobacter halotolerans TaxID=1146892 RepID=UPI001FD0DA90|nr:ABC transporter substrate-binding protein [Falsirhodobacter halotolerans]MCJ8139143.1 ABC transporter substrate-binding protein [Falsirhodobacter halotolerans]
MKTLIQLTLTAVLVASAAHAQGMTETMVAKPDIAALPGVALNQTLADALPEDIRNAGILKVATSLTPPISFHDDDGKLIGIDADLAAAFGIILGVDVEMTDVGGGPHIVPAILSGRFDMTISGINDDPELQKQVDVIDYMYDGTTIMVVQGNPLAVASMDDLCGRRVAVPVGTFQNRLAQAHSDEHCDVPMNIMSLPKMPDVLQAIRTGRADATVNGYATSVYSTEKQVGRGVGLQALPDIRLAVGYLGMLTAKDDTALRDTAAATLQQLVDSGAYQAIMDKWGLGPLAVESVKINDAANLAME